MGMAGFRMWLRLKKATCFQIEVCFTGGIMSHSGSSLSSEDCGIELKQGFLGLFGLVRAFFLAPTDKQNNGVGGHHQQT